MDSAAYAQRQNYIRAATSSLPYYCQHICWERESEQCISKMESCEKRTEHTNDTERDWAPVTADAPATGPAFDYPEGYPEGRVVRG